VGPPLERRPIRKLLHGVAMWSPQPRPSALLHTQGPARCSLNMDTMHPFTVAVCRLIFGNIATVPANETAAQAHPHPCQSPPVKP
jgi:hypothetical protein